VGRKSEYSQGMKIGVVEKYLAGEASLLQLARENDIGQTTVRRWIGNYQSMGSEGLATNPTNRGYSAEMKRSAVEEYLSGKHSLSELQKKYKIRSDHQLREWIAKYNGHEDFKQANSGGAIYMAKGRKTTQEERIEIVSDCIANNKDYGKTIERYGISYQQIYGWVRKYERDGVNALADRRGKRKDEASMTEVEKLRAQLRLREAENMRLQMENDLLKKLEALERGRNID
jgi:transposase